jgi:hypothetical protein
MSELELHHIIPVKQDGLDSLQNLKILCIKCHRTMEHQWQHEEWINKHGFICDMCGAMTNSISQCRVCDFKFCPICIHEIDQHWCEPRKKQIVATLISLIQIVGKQAKVTIEDEL